MCNFVGADPYPPLLMRFDLISREREGRPLPYNKTRTIHVESTINFVGRGLAPAVYNEVRSKLIISLNPPVS